MVASGTEKPFLDLAEALNYLAFLWAFNITLQRALTALVTKSSGMTYLEQ